MQKYGRIENGELVIVLPPLIPDPEKDKMLRFAPIPAFDQSTQAVFQTEAVESENYIDVGVEIRQIEQDDAEMII